MSSFAKSRKGAWKRIFGRDMNSTSQDCVSVTKRILEAVYRLPKTKLDETSSKKSFLATFLYLCCVNEEVDLTDEKVPGHTGMSDMPLPKIQEKKRVLGDSSSNKIQVLKQSQKDNPPIWETNFDMDELNSFPLYRLELNGVSATTLLLFTKLGAHESIFQDETNGKYSIFYPKYSVHLEGVNEREITIPDRLWQTKKNEEGMMQTMFGEGEKSNLGFGPNSIVGFPYEDVIYGKLMEGKLISAALMSTFLAGNSADDLVNDPRRQVEHLKFETNQQIYSVLFGVEFDEIYCFDEKCKKSENMKSLLAYGALVSDANNLFSGFYNPEKNCVSIFKFLRKRVSTMLFGEERLDCFFHQGLNMQDCFLRIRILFQFLIGGIGHSFIDGNCRMTALAYSWLKIIPERNETELQNPKSRWVGRNPYYQLLSSSINYTVVSIPLKRKKRNPITVEQLEDVVKVSEFIQDSIQEAQEISIQSFILKILKAFIQCNGVPNLLKSSEKPFSLVYPECLWADSVDIKKRLPPALKLYEHNLLSFLEQKVATSRQMELLNAYVQVKQSGKTFQTIFKGGRKFQNSHILLQMILKFVVDCIYQSDEFYENSFYPIENLKKFVQNNGKNWSEEGQVARNVDGCCRFPITLEKSNMFPKPNEITELIEEAKQNNFLFTGIQQTHQGVPDINESVSDINAQDDILVCQNCKFSIGSLF